MSSVRDNKELMGLFDEEARSLLAEIRNGLSLLEDESQVGGRESRVLRDLFRSSHTLKSSCRVVGLDQLGRIAEALEEIFKAARHGEMEFTVEMIPLLSTGVIACQDLLEEKPVVNYEEVLEQLNRLRNDDCGLRN